MITLSIYGQSPGELQKRKRNASWLEWRKRHLRVAIHPPLSDHIVLERTPYPISCSQWRSVTVDQPLLSIAELIMLVNSPASPMHCHSSMLPDVSTLSTRAHQSASVHFSCSTIPLGSSDHVILR